MLLERSLRVMLFAVCSTALAAGCGGLRRLPITGDDAGPGGSGGSSATPAVAVAAAAARRAPAAASAARSGTGGAGGSTTIVDAGGVDAPTCVAGGACVPANACHKGMFVCLEGGAMSCMELTDLQANGTRCDMDKVCHNGSCDSCVAGHGLRRDGQTLPRGQHRLRDGRAGLHRDRQQAERHHVRHRMVCQAGTCATCQAGGACTPTNKCHTGTLVCSGAAPSCTDTNTNVAAGTSCGTDMVCDGHGRVRRLRAGHGLRRPRQALPQGNHRLQHGHARLHRIGRRRRTAAPAARTWSARRGTARPARPVRSACPANPCHAGITVCSPSIACTDTGNALANGACVRHRQGLQRRHVRVVRGRLELPADQRLQDGDDVVRDRLARLHRIRQPRERHDLRHEHGLQHRRLRDLQRRRRVHADQPVPHGDADLHDRRADLHGHQPEPGRRHQLRHQPGLQDGKLRLVHGGSGVPADEPVQDRHDRRARPARRSAPRAATRAPGTLCGAGKSCANGVLTLPAMCNAAGTCAAATMQCPSGCNTAGTDCATCPTGQTSCPAGCRDLTSDPDNCSACGNACPVPAKDSGIPVCVSSSCGVKCNPGFLECSPASAGDVPADDVGLRGHDPRGVQGAELAVGGGQARLHEPGRSTAASSRSVRSSGRPGRRAATRSVRRSAGPRRAATSRARRSP